MAITPARQFATTRWSLVVAAREENAVARRALEELCRLYWYPLYAFVRRKGHDAEEAADLVQGFFASLLEKQWHKAADQQRGRFRSFLMASLEHYIANERRAAMAQKRGGGVKITGLDFGEGERRYSLEPAHEVTPDRIFLQKWATTVVETVMGRLGDEYHARGREELFAKLRGLLDGQGEERYAKVAADLGMNESAIKVAVHRMRKRLRELLREEVSQTVADQAEVDAELRELMEAL